MRVLLDENQPSVELGIVVQFAVMPLDDRITKCRLEFELSGDSKDIVIKTYKLSLSDTEPVLEQKCRIVK